MAAGFAYFTSADSGAPTLSGSVGAMISLLDWVLVSKGGWDKVFSGTNLAAYRSQTGNRFYLRVDDTQAKYARMRGYRDMTDISNGTNSFPNTTQGRDNTWGWLKSMTASNTPIRYWGIRTNQYITIVIEHGNINNVSAVRRSLVAFGDFPSYGETDPYNTCLIGNDSVNSNPNPILPNGFSSSTPISPITYFPTSDVLCAVAATFTGTVTPNAMICSPFGSVAYNQNDHWYTSNRLIISPFQILTSSSSNDPTYAVPRGRLPNIQQVYGSMPYTPHSGYPTYNEEIFTQNGRRYIALSGNYDGNSILYYDTILLEITDTDGAL